ncbi:MAG: CoA-transferase [Actinomycetota bacterium]|nr:CoA-transferase [Actinomycetota bacterium]
MSTLSPDELMGIIASRLLADHRVVFAGVGLPLTAAALAQRRHAPHLTIVLEGGIIGTVLVPGKLPISTNEMRAAVGAPMLTDITDIFLFAQRGFFDYGLLGAAQVDMFGNINTSIIGDPSHPAVRLPGTGGANDIISLCNETFIVTAHERRRFVERVDFVTSPAYLSGGDTRQRAGLVAGRVTWVVTDLGLMDFDPRTKRMRLRALQPGVSVADIRSCTDFDLLVPPDVEELSAPTAEELELYRLLRDGAPADPNLQTPATEAVSA